MKSRYWFGMAIGMLMAGVLFSGCGYFQKSAVNSAIKKVQEEMEQARGKEADRYGFGLFNEAQSLISQAQNDVEAGNYDEAEAKVQEASGKVKLAIEQTPGRRQEIQKKKKQIEDMQQEMLMTLEKAENSPSRSVAEAEITQARESFTQLQQEIQALFNKRQQEIEEYDQMLAQVQQVQASIQQAYDLTLADSANSLAQSINDQMGVFNELEPMVYLPDRAEAVTAAMDEFQSLMDQRKFEQAIEAGQNLQSELDSAIPAASQARAEKSIEQAEAQLVQATELGGMQLAAEQLEAGREALSNARTQLAASEYDAAYNLALQALGSADVAIEEIKSDIDQQISQLQNKVTEAEEAGADRFAPQALDSSKALLSQAFSQLSEGNYEQARQLQMDAAVQVERAFTEAKKGQAREKLQRVESVIEQCISQAAPKYVPESFQVANDKLKEAQTLFSREEFVEVHPVADLAENLAYKTLADLQELAGQRIEQANSQVVAAEEAQAEQYAPELLQQARVSLRKAETELASEQLKRSLEASDQSREQGRQAESKTYRLRTDEKMEEVKQERQLAIDSGAREHSSAIFLSAAQSEKESNEKYSDGQYEQALAAATESAQSYKNARMSKIQAAQSAQRSAVEAKAGEYDPEILSQAESTLSTAILAMEDKNYVESNQSADQARRLAAQAERTTWMKRAEAEIAQWEAAQAKARQNYAEEKAPDLLARSKDFGVEAKAEFTVQSYKPAYDMAVKAMEKIEEIEDKLGSEAQSTLARMKSRVDKLTPLVVDEFGRQRLGTLIQLSGQAARAETENNYQVVFSVEDQFETQAGVVESELKTHKIQYQKEQIQASLAEYASRGLTNFLPEQMEEIRTSLAEIGVMADEGTESEEGMTFDEASSRLDALVARVERIPQMADAEIEKTVAEIQSQLTEARQADAPNLIPEQYNEAVDSYSKMLNYPRGEGGNYQELHQLLVRAKEQAAEAYAQTNHAIDVQNYREVIQSYIKEMNSLLTSFSTVTDFDKRLLVAASSTKQTDVYRELQREITANTLFQRSKLLLDRARQLNAPDTEKHLNELILKTFGELVEMADYFERFGQYDKYDKELRDRFVLQAYDKLENVRKYSVEVQEILSGGKQKNTGLRLSAN
jgi:hypothetical protein